MSRWHEMLIKHPIHETIAQIQNLLSGVPKELDENIFNELYRLNKVLETLKIALDSADPDLIPFNRLDVINKHLKHPNVLGSIKSFVNENEITYLIVANDFLHGIIDHLNWIAPMVRDGDSQSAIRGSEEYIKQILNSLISNEKNIRENSKKIQSDLDQLRNESKSYEVLFQERKFETDKLIAQWQNQFSDAQEKRSALFNDWKNVLDKEIKEKSETITAGTQDAINKHKQRIESALNELERDSRAKHNAILELYQLSSGDSISGGYAQAANNEEDQANFWRWVSLGFIGVTILWLAITYTWCNGLCIQSDNQTNCQNCITATDKGFLFGDVGEQEANKLEPSQVPVNEESVSKQNQSETESSNSNNKEINNTFNWQKFLINFSLIGVLLFGAGFSSRQSNVHRNESIRTRRFALQVKALDPYISNFNEKDRIELKKQLSEKFFTGIDPTDSSRSDPSSEHAINSLVKAIKELIKSKDD